MRILGIGTLRNRGFTLLEILIVLIIVSIIAGFALLAVGDFGQARRVKAAAITLEKTIALAQVQAILESNLLGVAIETTRYRFYRYQWDKTQGVMRWHVITRDRLFRPHSLPKNMQLKINQNTLPDTPQILLSPSGDLTPFIITVQTQQGAPRFRIQGLPNSVIRLIDLQEKGHA